VYICIQCVYIYIVCACIVCVYMCVCVCVCVNIYIYVVWHITMTDVKSLSLLASRELLFLLKRDKVFCVPGSYMFSWYNRRFREIHSSTVPFLAPDIHNCFSYTTLLLLLLLYTSLVLTHAPFSCDYTVRPMGGSLNVILYITCVSLSLLVGSSQHT
jgi:hypothetical protein